MPEATPQTPAAAALPSAAARRAARAHAARWLLDTDAAGDRPALAALGWDDLTRLPGWVSGSAERTARLAVLAGAWSQAAALRRCIDGRVLGQLRMRLGAAAFDALMNLDDAAPAGDDELAADASLPVELAARGRRLLLSGIASSALRELVRERLWPGAELPLRLQPAAEADALIAAAERQLDEAVAPERAT